LNENSNPTQREHMRMALEAAARLNTDYFLTPPQSLTINGAAFNDGPYSLELYFHHNPEGLAEWADALGLAVTVRDLISTSNPLAEARGEAYGTPVRLWALGDESEYDRYSAVASEPVSLPSAWSAAAVSA
jgi:hypothetical protein